MNNNQQKHNWLIDAILFSGFLVCTILDLTGVVIHQWLGVAIGLLAFYHLLRHWSWIKCVTKRFIGKTSNQARRYYVIDAGLLLSFLVLLITGLVMSTWLNLELPAYLTWYDVHVGATLAALVCLLAKIGLHWRWIVKVTRQTIEPEAQPALHPATLPVTLRPVCAQPVKVPGEIDRRDFLKLMGVVGLASVLASLNALSIGESTLAQAAAETTEVNSTTSTAANSATASPTAAIPTTLTDVDTKVTPIAPANSASTETASVDNASQAAASDITTASQSTETANAASACTIRCPRGCSYPGQCRRYTDANSNRLCDLGECL